MSFTSSSASSSFVDFSSSAAHVTQYSICKNKTHWFRHRISINNARGTCTYLNRAICYQRCNKSFTQLKVKPWKKMLIYIYICSISHHHHHRSLFSHLNVIFDSLKHACKRVMCLEKTPKVMQNTHSFAHCWTVNLCMCIGLVCWILHIFLSEIESNVCS